MDEATARRMMERTKYGDKWAVFWCDEIADLAQFWLDNYKPTPTTTDWGEAQVNIYAKVEDQNG